MIYLFSGTPGSGKSLHATKVVIDYLKRNKPVICNYSLNLKEYKNIRPSRFIYVDNSEITPEYLTNFSRMTLKPGKENQALVCWTNAGYCLTAVISLGKIAHGG